MYESSIKNHVNNVAAQQKRRGIKVSQDNPTQNPLIHTAFQFQLRERGSQEQSAFFFQPVDDKSSRQLSSIRPHFRASSDNDSAMLPANNLSASSPSPQPVKENGDLGEITTKLFHELRCRISQDMRKSPDKVKILLSSIPASALDTLRADNGQTALEIAVDLKDLLAIKLLVEHGVDPSNASPDFPLAIHVAAERGDMQLTQLLISRGVDLNASPDGGDTPLILAAWRGHLAIVKLLVGNGARLDLCRADGWNVLMAAMQTGEVDVIKYLLGANKSLSDPFDINQQNGIGHTALSLAYAKHASYRRNAREDEKDLQDMIFLLQNQGASKEFLMSRYDTGYGFEYPKACIERAVRAGLGKEGDLDAKIAFVDAVEAFYHPKDTSYRSLLKNIPVETRYEEERDGKRAHLYNSH